ncbi:pilus assembly protein CpaF [Pullulanibacillus pueri]|uniref:Type II/IV secretion system protein n=1 Tax=Pullulanibacillus pueri TaxID=1437324 RepID=A0A8J2ZUR0_9BACL|nr:CpaF family protein [Pullulanibacillus pueri]MBM7681317.1 pilus assembly protein CpaF [Pullulanibacillus pueri]GGH77615.1 type II/IV secretion system protein [Pullulanibacillus pueri]
MVSDQVVHELIERLRETLDFMHSTTNEELLEYVEGTVFEYAKEQPVTSSEIKELVDRIYHALRGLDVLQPLIDDPTITEIMVNHHEEIFIERHGETVQVPVRFESQQKLEDIIQAIVSKVNRVVNESSPIVDARLQDGSRVNVVLPPISLKGPTMTIRKFPDKPLTVENLIQFQSISEEAADFLKQLVIAKYNIFIGGGTGSGKTTFLNVLSNFIPKHERIITIEDSAELQLRSVPNLVSMETRNANTEGRGEVTIRELIKTSLRMRPDRIIVGEVRGAETLDMLQAMNTGHDGSLSTGHANSVEDMLSRLETMVLSGAQLPVEVIRKQMSSALDIMVHLMRMRDYSRKVIAISEVLSVRDGDIELNPLFEFVEEGEGPDGQVLGSLQRTGNPLKNTFKLKMAGLGVPS